jgi:hypothetical protein
VVELLSILGGEICNDYIICLLIVEGLLSMDWGLVIILFACNGECGFIHFVGKDS